VNKQNPGGVMDTRLTHIQVIVDVIAQVRDSGRQADSFDVATPRHTIPKIRNVQSEEEGKESEEKQKREIELTTQGS
jgi:hypothetical protein